MNPEAAPFQEASGSGAPRASGLTDNDWATLIERVRSGACTPFIGAGAAAGTLPLGSEIAERWACEFNYPLEDRHDLARVAQFIGVHRGDAVVPKDRIRRELQGIAPPDFSRADEPHSLLAALPLPLYITTNYDDFMTQALRARHREPKRDFCRWNSSPALREEPRVLKPGFQPTPSTPVVYHLHGLLDVADSLVLSEDDYLDFLVTVSRDEKLLPNQVKRALAGTSLLFVGYKLADWDFRVIHRGLVMAGEPSLRRLSVTVQLPPAEVNGAGARDYLNKYFGTMNVRVHWGTASEFLLELHGRLRESDGGGA
ncbi:MAG TPA: SIR2 family protein [Gaiellaceae bacterium]|jgi:hypothetical protein